MSSDATPVSLAPLQADDVARLHGWQNDPALRDAIMGFRGPVPAEVVAAWLRGLDTQNLRSRVVYGVRQGEALKGVAQLQGIDWVHRVATLGLYVGDAADRGAGLGYAAGALLLDYAFAGLDLARVSLTVVASNTVAVRLYERLGFVREGVHRSAFFVGGRREDVAAYALLRDEWRPRG